MKKLKVLVLISGRGSNLKSLLESASNYEVAAVISDSKDAKGLNYALERAIPHFVFERAQYRSLRDQKEAIFRKAAELQPDLVALAGFMLVVQPEFVERFAGRFINIHPSLLPKFPGLDTHRRVLQEKEKEHGCSVHFVDRGVDTGPVIAQAKLEVAETDCAESLAARVLKLEHQLYPWVVENLARGEICVDKGRITFGSALRTEAASRGFILGDHL